MEKLTKKQILSELGDIPEEVYDGLVMSFITQTKTQIEAVRGYLKAGDSKNAVSLIHSIKGCSANLRLYEIFEFSKNIEIQLRENADAQDIDGNIINLVCLLDKTTV